jgi:LysR family transcriptional regulator, glycine cleavage system transcriptional activator
MPRKLPPLTAILAFETAARHGRMTLAANALHVSPGAVSKQVKLLQDWLGAPLFEGPKNAPQLSALGAALAPKLSAAFDQIQAAVQSAKQDNAQSIKVACYNTFAAKWLLPRMANLATTHPHMQVQLIASNDVDTQRLQGHDVAIIAEQADSAAPAGVLRQVLFAEQLGPVLSPQLLAKAVPAIPRNKASKTIAVAKPSNSAKYICKTNKLHIQTQYLLALPRLHTKTRPSAWAMWAQAAGVELSPMNGPAANQTSPPDTTLFEATQSHGVAPNLPPIPQASQNLQNYQHYYFALEAALRGQGVCVAPQHLVADDIASTRLAAPLGFAPSGLAYVALIQADAKPAVKAFVTWLREQDNS